MIYNLPIRLKTHMWDKLYGSYNIDGYHYIYDITNNFTNNKINHIFCPLRYYDNHKDYIKEISKDYPVTLVYDIDCHVKSILQLTYELPFDYIVLFDNYKCCISYDIKNHNKKVFTSSLGFPCLRLKFYLNHKNKIFDVKKLKNNLDYNNIFWYGSLNGDRGRKEVINFLSKHNFNIIHKEIDICDKKLNLLDLVIHLKCFCGLSLDGRSIFCYRDSELSLHKVPILRHTYCKDKLVIPNFCESAYLSRNINNLLKQIQNIKNDIENNIFDKNLLGFNISKYLNEFKFTSLLHSFIPYYIEYTLNDRNKLIQILNNQSIKFIKNTSTECIFKYE